MEYKDVGKIRDGSTLASYLSRPVKCTGLHSVLGNVGVMGNITTQQPQNPRHVLLSAIGSGEKTQRRVSDVPSGSALTVVYSDCTVSIHPETSPLTIQHGMVPQDFACAAGQGSVCAHVCVCPNHIYQECLYAEMLQISFSLALAHTNTHMCTRAKMEEKRET